MAYKHIDKLIDELSEYYQKAQAQYEIAAEAFTSGMVSPDIYQGFRDVKNKLDIELSNLSGALRTAKDQAYENTGQVWQPTKIC